MRDKTKRAHLFTHFKNKLQGNIFLQETYSMPRGPWRNGVMSNEWGSKTIISSGSCHSRGVAILLPKNMKLMNA
jgi:hypothetical protein